MDSEILFEYLNIVLGDIYEPNITIDESLVGYSGYLRNNNTDSPYLIIVVKYSDSDEIKKVICKNNNQSQSVNNQFSDSSNNTNLNLIVSPLLATLFLIDKPSKIYTKGINVISFLPHAAKCIIELPTSLRLDQMNISDKNRIESDIKRQVELLLENEIISRETQFNLKINELIPIQVSIKSIEPTDLPCQNDSLISQFRTSNSTMVVLG